MRERLLNALSTVLPSRFSRTGKVEEAPQASAVQPVATRQPDSLVKSVVLRADGWARADLDKFKSALLRFQHPERPNNADLVRLYDNVMLDAHLASLVNTRRIRVQAERFVVRHKETGEIDMVRTRLFHNPWFNALVGFCIDSRLYGHTLLEIQGLDEDGEIAGFALLPRTHVLQQKGLVLRQAGDQFGVPYREAPYELWTVEIGEPKDPGLLAQALPEVTYMRGAGAAWDEFTALFGVPLVHATTSERDRQELDRIDQFLEQFRNASWARFPEGTQVSITESKQTDASKVFYEHIALRQKRLSKLILGVTMLTEDGASLSQSQVHERVADDYLRADLRYIQDFVNWHLWWRLKLLGYDLEGYEGVYQRLVDEEAEAMSKRGVDTEKQIAIDAQIAAMGFELDQAYLEQTYGTKIKGLKAQVTPFAKAQHKGGIPPQAPPTGRGILTLEDRAGREPHSCCTPLAQLPEDEEDDYDRAYTRMLRQFHEAEGAVAVPAAYTLHIGDKLMQAVTKGYIEGDTQTPNASTPALEGLDYDSPDNLRIALFRANVYHFSAASSFAECIELRQLLEDSNYDWPTFKRAVQDKGLKDLRLSYLRTEYNHAIAASQNAANWYRQQADSELFDLQYRAVLDDRTRSEHAALNGLTARADDPVWNTIYPPNGWNCRCEVIQVAALPGRGDVSLDAGLVNEAVKPDFRFNFGERGQIFQNGLRVFDKFPEEKTLNRRKYGLPDWATLDRTALAAPALGEDTKTAYLQWWDRQVMAQGKGTEDLYFKDYSGLHVRLPKGLRSKFDNDRYRAKGEDRWAMAPMVADIVAKADEVWVQFNKSAAGLKTTYLRNYNDRTYAVVVETTDALDVITWYPVKPQEIGKQRSGILLKR